MTELLRARFFAILLFMTLLLTTGSISAREGQGNKPVQLPSGNWSFSAHPYFGPGFDSRPVVVISVTTYEDGGLAIKDIGLKNLSSKPITAVKLSWYLSTEQDPTDILMKGQTPLIAISGGLPVGKRRLLKFPLLSFANIAKPLQPAAGFLSGDYRVEVEVSELMYEDGSSSANAFNSPGKALDKEHLIRAVSFTRLAPQAACARQKCKYAGPVSHYECEASGNPEYCNNRNTSCCNVLCGEPPPGPGGFLD